MTDWQDGKPSEEPATESAAPPPTSGAPERTAGADLPGTDAPIVGIGASAGGLEALEAFFEHMPEKPGAAFVVVQHLAPEHPTLMPEILARRTPMPVLLAVDGGRAEPNHVYVIPPNASLTIHGGALAVRSPMDPRHMRIDGFFCSLAEDQGPNAICVVLSGTGADGSLGVRAIKERGGMAMAQDMESARYDSMPRGAIELGLVDYVLPPEKMGSKLIEYILYPRRVKALPVQGDGESDGSVDTLRKVCALLRRKTGHDFGGYRPATLVRRIQRRMRVAQVAEIGQYLEKLRDDPGECDRLFKDLLIGVTHFFRDPEVFAELAATAIPEILRGREVDSPVRVWVPGCATGEEAYSIAILLREALAKTEPAPAVKVFATDIDEQALETARIGRYPEGIAEHVSAERLDRFFVKQDGFYQVDKALREMCLFSTHNLIADPPFSRLDLVSCRNLLIYLETSVQRQLVPLFHYALRAGGHLLLGPSESLAAFPELFRMLSKKHRLFKRNDALLSPPLTLSRRDGARGARPAGDGGLTPISVRDQGVARLFDRLLLSDYAPAAVLINERADVVYTSGGTSKYLELPPGVTSLNVIEMARQTLRPELHAAIHGALTTRKKVVRENVMLDTNGQLQRLSLVVRPLPELGPESGLLLVVFLEVGPAIGKDQAASEGLTATAHEPLAQALEAELRSTKDHLQATIEELETSNEELKSANEELLSTNEELQSTNEELQSTNEELQTSKEELQSINEELQTVNSELSRKLEELDRVNSDLQNLFASTHIATVFLDDELRIKKFSDTATQVFRLIATDVGRPITDIATTLSDTDLVADVREVLSRLTPKERQVTGPETGKCYIRRIRPYRSVDNVIDGVVITFVDITELKRTQERAAWLAAIVESSQDSIVGMSLDGTITSWNTGAEQLYGHLRADAVGRSMSMMRVDGAELPPVLDQIRTDRQVGPFETVHQRKDGSTVDVLVAFFPVKDATGVVVGMASIARDMSERKRHEKALEEADRRKDEFLAVLGHELRNPLVPIRNAAAVLLRSDARDITRPARMIERQVTYMTRLIDDLLDVARITTGKVVLRKKPVDLVEMVHVLVDDWQARASEAKVTLAAKLPDEPVQIVGDPTRLVQALGNLLHNAFKFTLPGGRVTVEVELDDEGEAIVRVRDSGVGMNEEALGRLFKPFASTERSAAIGGLGLGLALAKGMVELHGGTLRGASRGPGRGSTFTVRLPIHDGVTLTLSSTRTPISPSGPASSTPTGPKVVPVVAVGPSRRVLLIEDNHLVAESMAMLLEMAGHTVQIAHDAAAGIAAAKAHPVDVVLCDIGLPGDLDGYDVARALRADPTLKSTCCVALSGYGQEADRQRAREAGFDDHLVKPVDPEVLDSLLATLPERPTG